VKILIVDDSRAMRIIVKRMLRAAGIEVDAVSEASNGAEAYELVQSVQPDLILSDWNMPEMSGIEFLKKLRESGSTIRFGLVTSECTAEMRGLAAAAGAQFLIAKPFTAEQFQEALEWEYAR